MMKYFQSKSKVCCCIIVFVIFVRYKLLQSYCFEYEFSGIIYLCVPTLYTHIMHCIVSFNHMMYNYEYGVLKLISTKMFPATLRYFTLFYCYTYIITFWLSDDRPVLEIVRIWSDSITVGWSILIEVEWFRFEYRPITSSEWHVSRNLDGDRRLYNLLDLESEAEYEMQLVIKRAEGGSIATTIPITVVTCARGYSGDNCTEGKIITFGQASSTPITFCFHIHNTFSLVSNFFITS